MSGIDANNAHDFELAALSVEQWTVVLWRRLHGRKRLPRKYHEARRSLHQFGLLKFDDSTELSELGELWIRTLGIFASRLTEPQRRHLEQFSSGFGYGGRGGSVALRSLEAKGLAKAAGVETHNLSVDVTPLGHAVCAWFELSIREDWNDR